MWKEVSLCFGREISSFENKISSALWGIIELKEHRPHCMKD
jgi:hypothetical protein